ncbi:MAG TPA: cation diffusion facilitator family transporter [Candidatus Kapabacteria bacterium]|jgi:cation diffusion facilitator family transporter|nr:cation diffusion facilitator family transporter [Candidatus Kapabacteria bacterium]
MSNSLPALKRVTLIALLANAALFGLKLWGFSLSGSVALLSDALNSLLDVASTTAVLISVQVARKMPDREHPFGHSRAEPIAGFVIAVIACVLGIEVLQESTMKFVLPHPHEINPLVFAILGVAILAKIGLSMWQGRVGRAGKSPAVVALAVDSRNDVLSSIAALVGITGASLGYESADEIAGAVVGCLILWSGVKIIRENLDMLLGRAPSDLTQVDVLARVRSIDGVEEVRFCRGHYVGNELHFEIIIACSAELSTRESAEIADRVRNAAETADDIAVAFVHVDTVESPHHYPDLLDRI